MFIPWNCVDSPLHLFGRFRNPNPNLPCAPPALDGCAAAHPTPYPRRLLEHASVQVVSFSFMISKFSRSTARMACDSPQSLPYQMLSVPMVGPDGCGVRWHSSGGAICRQPDPWEVGRDKVIGILVEAKKEVKRRKIPVLATVRSTAALFEGINPLSSNGRGRSQAVVSGDAVRWMWW